MADAQLYEIFQQNGIILPYLYNSTVTTSKSKSDISIAFTLFLMRAVQDTLRPALWNYQA